MIDGKRKKRGLYYLLPGMNRGNRERRKRIFLLSLLFGVLVAALVGWLVYWANIPHIHYTDR